MATSLEFIKSINTTSNVSSLSLTDVLVLNMTTIKFILMLMM